MRRHFRFKCCQGTSVYSVLHFLLKRESDHYGLSWETLKPHFSVFQSGAVFSRIVIDVWLNMQSSVTRATDLIG